MAPPVQSWTLGAKQVVTTPTAIQDVLDEIANALTSWQVADSGAGFLLIKPPVGAPTAVEDTRILIGGDGVGPNAAQMEAPHTSKANQIFFLLSPNFGADVLSNVWNSASPPMTSGDSSGYWSASADVTGEGQDLDRVYTLECEEMIAVFFRNETADDTWGFVAGSIFIGPGPNDRPANERIYGSLTSGEDAIPATFNASTTQFSSTNNLANDAQTGMFFWDDLTIFVQLTKFEGRDMSDPAYTDTAAGDAKYMAINYRERVGALKFRGTLRQIRMAANNTSRKIIQDGSFVQQAVLIGSSELAAANVLAFGDA